MEEQAKPVTSYCQLSFLTPRVGHNSKQNGILHNRQYHSLTLELLEIIAGQPPQPGVSTKRRTPDCSAAKGVASLNEECIAEAIKQTEFELLEDKEHTASKTKHNIPFTHGAVH